MRILKTILSAMVAVTVVLSFSACGKTAEEKLSGRWEIDEDSSAQLSSLEFFEDGKYTSNHPNYEGDYSVDDDRLYLEGVLVDAKTYTFDVKGDKLTLYTDSGLVEAVYNKVDD